MYIICTICKIYTLSDALICVDIQVTISAWNDSLKENKFTPFNLTGKAADSEIQAHVLPLKLPEVVLLELSFL